MKTRAFAFMLGAIVLGAAALAGSADDIDNCCFVDRQCSSDQQWIDGYWAFQNNQCPAPAQSQPTGGAPAQVDNCCFVDRLCNSDQEWTDGYWAYQNNQCGAPSQTPASSQPTGGAPAQVDNCCFVDRQCSSDQEWNDGYWAYQNNQCGAPTSSQPTGGAPSQVDNCCFVDRECHTDQDWISGYHAYQNHQCGARGQTGNPHPGIKLVGDADMVAYYEQALDRLRDRLPHRYAYTVNGLDRIEQFRNEGWSQVDVVLRTFFVKWIDGFSSHNRSNIRESAILVHEACHVHRYDAGYRVGVCDHEGYTREELFCREKELEVVIELGAPTHVIDSVRDTVARTRAGIQTPIPEGGCEAYQS